MLITKDVYSFKLLRDGISLEEFLRDSSKAYFEMLRRNGLIRTDDSGKVYLTFKGQAAKKIGVERYLELEKFEEEIMNDNEKSRILDKYSFFIICFLNLILAMVLFHVVLLTASA